MEAKFINENYNKVQNDLDKSKKILKFYAKPSSLSEIPDSVISSLENYDPEQSADIKENNILFINNWLDTLLYVDPDEYTLPEDLSYERLPDFLEGRTFVVNGEDGLVYVVDTSGYDYPRYVARIVEE
jgi:hypothetical protein